MQTLWQAVSCSFRNNDHSSQQLTGLHRLTNSTHSTRRRCKPCGSQPSVHSESQGPTLLCSIQPCWDRTIASCDPLFLIVLVSLFSLLSSVVSLLSSLAAAHFSDRTAHLSLRTLHQAIDSASTCIHSALCLTIPGPAECAKR